MPLFDQSDILQQTKVRQNVPEPRHPLEETEQTGFRETVSAFFAIENPIFNATKEIFAPAVSHEIDPNFNAIDTLEQERPDLIDRAEAFIGVVNREEFQRKALNIDFELEQREKFANAPTLTKVAAGLAASITDPLILIPYVGIASKASRAGRALAGAKTGAVVGAGASVVREGVLQATQETRTAEESVINIIAETALGGLLGAGVGALAKGTRGASEDFLAKALAGEDFKIKINDDNTLELDTGSVGAAKRGSELQQLGLAHINERLVKVLTLNEGLRPPDLRAILSPSESVRKVGEVFYNSNYIRKKNIEGIASGPKAQTAIFRRDQETIQTIRQIDDLYIKHTGKGRLRSAIKVPKGKISNKEFSERMWRNLTDNKRVDDIPEINAASKIMRSQMDRMAKDLQQAKLLDPEIDPEFMANYMTRIYDLNVLNNPQSQQDFVRVVGNWFRTHHKDASIRETPLDSQSAQAAANDTLDKIRGETETQIAMQSISENFVSKGKFVKERQLLIPDAEIAPFLQKDATRLFKGYMNRAARLLETQKGLERAGFNNIQDVISQIKSEAADATRNLSSPKSIAKASKKFANEEKLATMMYRSMLGQLRKPGTADRFAEGLLNYQFVRLLGGVTISSIPEVYMIPFRVGLLNTLRDGYLPMLRSMKTAKFTKDQLNDLSGALEFEQSNVLRALGSVDDIDNMGRNQTTYDRIQTSTVDGFVKATGIGVWTGTQRRVSSQVFSAGLVRTLKAGPKGKDIEALAAIGIDKSQYSKLRRQIGAHVQEYKGSFVINPHLWKDKEALEIFQSAVQVQIEGTILKPSVESLPFFVQRNRWVQVAFQFKAFMSSATGKITISALQRRDANVLSGLIGLIAMGSLSGITHDLIAGRDVDFNPEELLRDGISRSGILGLLGTVVLDVGSTFYGEKTRRFGGKNLSSAILGPTAGQFQELGDAIANLTDGNVSSKDHKRLLRMIPFMNLFYIKGLTQRALED